MTTQSTIVAVTDVRKVYGKANEKQYEALHDVSFQI